jgi:predicted phosphodiesterase
MRIYALSDIHIDYAENRKWLMDLSTEDFRDDILILAGDVSDVTRYLVLAFSELMKRFKTVLFVPGNHDLWTYRNKIGNSLVYFEVIRCLAADFGVNMKPITIGNTSIIPLLGWYDYTFGNPGEELSALWRDFQACTWPENFNEQTITRHFIDMNEPFLTTRNDHIISFSHFMPRIDLMPSQIPLSKQALYPVLGTALLEEQIRRLGPEIHIYGHTHVNMSGQRDGISYINNAFGYPNETRIAKKELQAVFEI